MNLTERNRIWIYGYGLRGRKIAERLAQEGMQVYGYMDRKPEQYKEARKKERIVSPEEAKADENTVVICALSNVFAHEEVAAKLAVSGFQYILYKSFCRGEAAKKCNALYDDLTEICAEIAVEGREIPNYAEINTSQNRIENNNGDMVHTRIPVELLFGLTRELLESSFEDKREDLLNEIPDQSLLYYTLPKGMMHFFMNELDCEAWERCGKLWFACRNAQSFSSSMAGIFDEENQKKNIESRYDIFQRMEDLFNENPSFFDENPISVVWNEKGRFNIQDGNNRAAFLLAKGMYLIPAKMPGADYCAWMDAGEALHNVRQAYLETGHVLRSPVLHPLLQDIPCTLKYYSHKKVVLLTDWLWKKQINPVGMTVCEYCCENDLCGSHFARMGASLTVIDAEEQLRLHKALDHLYHIKHCRYKEQFEKAERFQIVLSNRKDALEKMAEKGIQANWYALEFVDWADEEIETMVVKLFSRKPEYLMHQLVGNKIYKVVAIEGEE